MNLELLFHLTVATCAVTFVYYTWRTKVPLVATQRGARECMLAAIREEVAARPGQSLKIYDLGSGLGGLCVAVARACPQAQVLGLEMAWPAWLFSVLRGWMSGCGNVRFQRCDFWKHDISDGDIVMCYLGDIVMPPLRDKLRREARHGRLFISNTFPLPPDWPPVKRIAIPAVLSKEIIIYRQEG